MVVGRALRATGCATCRLHLVRSFTSLAVSQNTLQTLGRFPKSASPFSPLRRSSHLAHDGPEPKPAALEAEHDDTVGKVIEAEGEELSKVEDLQVSTMPWYLQVESPKRAPQPLSERQQIPDLPEDPPPLLQPLLQQISIDLGLDDLSLLDLRKLDPPPALGANLLMIIGTARSEKHLHVSADRLCRWLRSNYKLRPDADGLLGRNELKLKLRRKAKRAKLLGNSADDNADDGVRTGWVCVDIGVVEGAEGTQEVVQKKDFIGFGRQSDGVRIVVQMVTEEKREQIDLEQLWGGILKRGNQPVLEKADGSDALFPDEIEYPEGQADPRERFKYLPEAPGQKRAYHTSARQLSTTSQLAASPSSSIPPTFKTSQPKKEDLQGLLRETRLFAIAPENLNELDDILMRCRDRFSEIQNDEGRLFILDFLADYLKWIPKGFAIRALGSGNSDRSSTPFLKWFYDTLSLFPTSAEAEIRIQILDYAMKIGHPGYKVGNLLTVLAELQENAVEISLPVYVRVIRRILRGEDETSNGTDVEALENAVKVLRTMERQGIQVLTEDMLVLLQETTCEKEPVKSGDSQSYPVVDADIVQIDLQNTFDLPSIPMAPVQLRLHTLMKSLELPLFSDESRMRLMACYARLGHWVEFWEVFRQASAQGVPQSANMYTFLFILVAQSKNQKGCIAVLRTWVAEMGKEQPAVELVGDVGEAVKACILVADPDVQQQYTADEGARGEFIDMWRQCERAQGQKGLLMYE